MVNDMSDTGQQETNNGGFHTETFHEMLQNLLPVDLRDERSRTAEEILFSLRGTSQNNPIKLLEQYDFPQNGVFDSYSFALSIERTGYLPAWSRLFKKDNHLLSSKPSLRSEVHELKDNYVLVDDVIETEIIGDVEEKYVLKVEELIAERRNEIFEEEGNDNFIIKVILNDVVASDSDSDFDGDKYIKDCATREVEAFCKYYGQGTAKLYRGDNRYYIRMIRLPGESLSFLYDNSLPKDAHIKFFDMIKNMYKANVIYDNLGYHQIMWDKESGMFFPINMEGKIFDAGDLDREERRITLMVRRIFKKISKKMVGRSDALETLLERITKIDAKKGIGTTQLHLAAQEGNLEVVQALLEKGNAKVDANAEMWNGGTSLHLAAQEGHLEVVKTLLKHDIKVNAKLDSNGVTPLHLATQEGHLEVVQTLLEKGAKVNAKMWDEATSLHLAVQWGHLEIAKTLLKHGAKADAKTIHGLVPLHLAIGAHKQRLAPLFGDRSEIIRAITQYTLAQVLEVSRQSAAVGLEAVAEDVSNDTCRLQRRRRRALGRCAEGDEQERQLFPYEPLEESAPVEYRQEAWLYSQLALTDAWRQGRSPDALLRYQRYLGDILEEGENNQSRREKQLLRKHYKQSRNFFQNHPKENLLEIRANDFEPLAGHSVLLEHGQHSLLVFNEGPRYQLYSPDFNYRQRLQSRPGISWTEMSALIRTFFQWKTGSRDYRALVFKELPERTLKSLRKAPFWHPDALAPDSVLLAQEHAKGIEGIPARVVRELVRVDGQVVEASALHAEFFSQHTAGIQLRLENLHSVLGELNPDQRQALVQVVRRYHWEADSTLLKSLDAEAQPLFADYQQQVMRELKTAETLTPERLSALSWQAMEQAFKRAEISPELTQQAVTHLKEFQASTAKHAWAKGMATQTLFFLPDMIRSANTGQIDSLAKMAGMTTVDMSVNHLYGNLLEHLAPTLSEARLGLLRKLPVTSPVFKALTIYSIVELTQQYQSLPPDSEQRQTIQHRLVEQYFTVGLMTAEVLFGWELGPVWIALIAEQLIFEAFTFRKEHQLDIPFWEAFIMSLGFEQDKLQHILEERQLVEFNLATVNNINTQAQPPYGLVLVKVPLLGPLTWTPLNEQQVPDNIRKEIIHQRPSFGVFTEEREFKSFRQVTDYRAELFPKDSLQYRNYWPVKTRWEQGIYYAKERSTVINFSPIQYPAYQEDNIFQARVQGANSTFEQRSSVMLRDLDYGFLGYRTPIQITGEGLAALYAVNQTSGTAASQKNLLLEFDPREGDISLEMDSSGWRELIHEEHPSPSFTVLVGPKDYPPEIQFQPNLGILRVEDKSRRLHSNYFISSDTTPFYLYDDTLTTRIAISPPPRNRSIGFIISDYGLDMLQLKTWSPERSQISPDSSSFLVPQHLCILNFPNKQSLQLILEKQQISGEVTLSAKQVEVLYAKGRDVYQDGIVMASSVANFTVTLLGHLRITQGKTHLYFIGEIPDDAELIRYSKPISAPHWPVYQLELSALQPVLESLSRPHPRQIKFSTPGLNYSWVPGVEPPSMLKITGRYQDQQAQLLLEHNKTSLSQLEEQKPRLLAVDHYIPQATLDSQLVLQQVTPGRGNTTHLAYPNGHCDSLQFQSVRGSVLHRFPAQQTLTLNGIDYKVIGKRLYAVGAPNGIIDGEQLIRYRTSNRRVGIRLNSSLAESTLSLEQDALTINELTLRHLPNQTPIVFGEEAFPLKALKESAHRHRHRRHHRHQQELLSVKPLASGASQSKPWTSKLVKQVKTVLGWGHCEWPALFSAWGSNANQKPTISDSGQPMPQGLQRVEEYTAGHMQGALQLADLLIRKLIGNRDQHSVVSAPDPMDDIELTLQASMQQQMASFYNELHCSNEPPDVEVRAPLMGWLPLHRTRERERMLLPMADNAA